MSARMRRTLPGRGTPLQTETSRASRLSYWYPLQCDGSGMRRTSQFPCTPGVHSMQRSTKSTVIVAAIALAAFVTSFTATTIGQGQAPPPPAGTPPKPLVPVAASSVAANPDPYIGEYVTMTGAVEANLSKTSFSVD